VSNHPDKYDVLRGDGDGDEGQIVGIVRRDVGTLEQREEYGAFQVSSPVCRITSSAFHWRGVGVPSSTAQRKIHTSIRATLTQKQMLNPNAGMSYAKIDDIIEAAYRSRPPVA
jgi:hypothetical protein